MKVANRLFRCAIRRLSPQAGSSLVEFAVAASIYLSLFFGLIQTCFALYTYNFVCDAAREATRYVVVRGANSCLPNGSFPDCNLLPTDVTSTTDPAQNPVLAYLNSLKYPGLDPNRVSAAVTWSVATQGVDGSGNPTTTWATTAPCTGSIDSNGNACNAPGNAVTVVVKYAFPFAIPYLKFSILNVGSTSQMVVNY